jgi:hypothetical protein
MKTTLNTFSSIALPVTVVGRAEQCLHVHDQIVAFQVCAGRRRIASGLRAR